MMVWKKGKQELVSLLPSVTKYIHWSGKQMDFAKDDFGFSLVCK